MFDGKDVSAKHSFRTGGGDCLVWRQSTLVLRTLPQRENSVESWQADGPSDFLFVH